MPSPDPVAQIRAARPSAPPALRERVRAIAARQPEPSRPFLARLSLRRSLLVAAPLAAAVALGTAGVLGLARSDAPLHEAAEPAQTVPPFAGGGDESAAERASGEAVQDSATMLQPDPSRPQRVESTLTLRVDDAEAVSDATKRAMAVARSLGGFVQSVAVDTEADRGNAVLTLRVPVERAQDAIVRLSALGTILAQRAAIEDLGEQLDSLDARIPVVEGEIADLEAQLGRTDLSSRERAELRSRLETKRMELEDLRSARRNTAEQARLATITVAITTEDATGARPEGRLGRAADEALDILAWEALVALYVAVALAPLALLGGGVFLALRARRRRAEAELLEHN